MAEFFALLTTAITEPNHGTLSRIEHNRRQDVATALRLKAEEVRKRANKYPTYGAVPTPAVIAIHDQAAGLDHLALLVEHHPAFPNIPDEAMPPGEFCKWQPRPAPKGFGTCVLADA